jgi:uncharacterized protein (DUF3084 family)
MATPIETISQFVSFIDLIKNPDRIADLVTELKRVRDENEKLVTARSTLDKVDAYVKKAEADIDKQYATLNQEIMEQNTKVDKFYEVSSKKGSELAAKEEALSNRSMELDGREVKVTQREKDADKVMKDAQALQAALDIKNAELVAYKQALDEKAAKIAAIVG